MTIEIRQLVIRAVAEPRSAVAGSVRHPGEKAVTVKPVTTGGIAIPPTSQERRALVAACVREVLRELRKTRER